MSDRDLQEKKKTVKVKKTKAKSPTTGNKPKKSVVEKTTVAKKSSRTTVKKPKSTVVSKPKSNVSRRKQVIGGTIVDSWTNFENLEKYNPTLIEALVVNIPRKYYLSEYANIKQDFYKNFDAKRDDILYKKRLVENIKELSREGKDRMKAILDSNEAIVPDEVKQFRAEHVDFSGYWDNILGFRLNLSNPEYLNPYVLRETSVDKFVETNSKKKEKTRISSFLSWFNIINKGDIKIYRTTQGKELCQHLQNYKELLPEDLARFSEPLSGIGKIPSTEIIVKVSKCSNMIDLISAYKEARMHNKVYTTRGCDENGQEINGSQIVVEPYMISPMFDGSNWFMVFVQGVAKGKPIRDTYFTYDGVLQLMNKLWSLGFIHGDAHRGNVMYDGTKYTLIDLESCVKVPIKYRNAYKKAIQKQMVNCVADENYNDMYPNRMNFDEFKVHQPVRISNYLTTGDSYENAYFNTLSEIGYLLGQVQEPWINVKIPKNSNTGFFDDQPQSSS